jgi:magnesium-transporting ATPase (P-type)
MPCVRMRGVHYFIFIYVFIVYVIHMIVYCYERAVFQPGHGRGWPRHPQITIIVVAVPEGLPLAVTISLAYSMKKMMKGERREMLAHPCDVRRAYYRIGRGTSF